MKNKIDAKGFEIGILTQKDDEWVSLTDIARYQDLDNPRIVVANWLSSYSTIDFLATWEEINNPHFKRMEFHTFRNSPGRLIVTPQRWIQTTGAIGIKSSRGRYGSGTFAHPDIAFEFASWISPQFKLYIIKEYQRLKQSENYQQKLDWSVKRDLAKLNYRVHTDAISEFLIPKVLSKSQIRSTYLWGFFHPDFITNFVYFYLTIARFFRTIESWNGLMDVSVFLCCFVFIIKSVTQALSPLPTH